MYWMSAKLIWRVVSEFLRADYRGERKISAYQIMAGLGVLYGLIPAVTLDASGVEAHLGRGVAALWSVPVLLLLAQGAWGQSVGVQPGVIEAADAGKTGGKRDVGDGQPGFGQQPFCEQQAARLLHLFW